MKIIYLLLTHFFHIGAEVQRPINISNIGKYVGNQVKGPKGTDIRDKIYGGNQISKPSGVNGKESVDDQVEGPSEYDEIQEETQQLTKVPLTNQKQQENQLKAPLKPEKQKNNQSNISKIGLGVVPALATVAGYASSSSNAQAPLNNFDKAPSGLKNQLDQLDEKKSNNLNIPLVGDSIKNEINKSTIESNNRKISDNPISEIFTVRKEINRILETHSFNNLSCYININNKSHKLLIDDKNAIYISGMYLNNLGYRMNEIIEKNINLTDIKKFLNKIITFKEQYKKIQSLIRSLNYADSNLSEGKTNLNLEKNLSISVKEIKKISIQYSDKDSNKPYEIINIDTVENDIKINDLSKYDIPNEIKNLQNDSKKLSNILKNIINEKVIHDTNSHFVWDEKDFNAFQLAFKYIIEKLEKEKDKIALNKKEEKNRIAFDIKQQQTKVKDIYNLIDELKVSNYSNYLYKNDHDETVNFRILEDPYFIIKYDVFEIVIGSYPYLKKRGNSSLKNDEIVNLINSLCDGQEFLEIPDILKVYKNRANKTIPIMLKVMQRIGEIVKVVKLDRDINYKINKLQEKIPKKNEKTNETFTREKDSKLKENLFTDTDFNKNIQNIIVYYLAEQIKLNEYKELYHIKIWKESIDGGNNDLYLLIKQYKIDFNFQNEKKTYTNFNNYIKDIITNLTATEISDTDDYDSYIYNITELLKSLYNKKTNDFSQINYIKNFIDFLWNFTLQYPDIFKENSSCSIF
jgi:hypothetical protein